MYICIHILWRVVIKILVTTLLRHSDNCKQLVPVLAVSIHKHSLDVLYKKHVHIIIIYQQGTILIHHMHVVEVNV